MSTIIDGMDRNRPNREQPSFGVWLAGQLRRHGMNQREFASRMGVGTSTVSRWIGGRVPEAALVERIADVLVLDYDLVATKAGYRPGELMDDDLQEWEVRLVPLMRKVQWDDDRLRIIEGTLNSMIGTDRGRR